jgi:hypothetical protein
MCIFSVSAFGNAYGYVSRGRANFDQTVVLEKRTIDRLTMIFSTSRHSLFYAKDGTVLLVRSEDIVELRTHAPEAQGAGLFGP